MSEPTERVDVHEGRCWSVAWATVQEEFGDEGVRTWWLHSATPGKNDMRVEAQINDVTLYEDGQPGSVHAWVASQLGVPNVELLSPYPGESPLSIRVLSASLIAESAS